MKFNELTQEQQEHFLKMIDKVGEPPEGTTHVDFGNVGYCMWLQLNQDDQYFYDYDEWELATGDNISDQFYELPEKPWCNPPNMDACKLTPHQVAMLSEGKIVRLSSEEKITSDGGSSSYYDFYIPLDRVEINEESGTVKIRLEDYIKFGLDNDFDRGNLAKANHRIGKKAGNNLDYDANKMQYYVGQIKKNCGVSE